MRSVADCQVHCTLVQVVLAWHQSRPGRLLKRSALSVSRCKLHLSNPGSLLEFLVPLLEGQSPFQGGVAFANRLTIQSHRPAGWSDRRWRQKCQACRNYKQVRGNGPFLGTGTHAQQSSRIVRKSLKNGNVPSVPTFPRHPAFSCFMPVDDRFRFSVRLIR